MKTTLLVRIVGGFAASTLLFGCAIGNKVDKEALGRVKRAALVGLTIDERQPVSGESFGRSLLGMEDDDGMGHGKINFEIKNEKHVDAGYDIAVKTLGERLKINFLPRGVVAQNAEIKSLFNQKTASFQVGVPPLKPYYDRFEAQNIPQAYYVQHADKAALNSIAKALGVDTLVIITSKTDLAASIVGKMSSTANLNLMFYDPAKSEFSTHVAEKGESIDTKDNKIMGFADSNEMHIQSLEAMKSALSVASQKL